MAVRRIAANIIKTGYMYSITATALKFFLAGSGLNKSLSYGNAIGVGTVGYLTAGALLAAGEGYIDDRTETDN